MLKQPLILGFIQNSQHYSGSRRPHGSQPLHGFTWYHSWKSLKLWMGNTLSALFTNLPGSLFLASTGAIKVEGKISIGSEWETSSQNVLQGLFWSPVTWWIALSEDRSCQWQNACGGFINSTVMFTLSSNKYILWLYELCSVCNDPWWHEVTPKWSSQSFDNRPIKWDPNSNGAPNTVRFFYVYKQCCQTAFLYPLDPTHPLA